MLMFRRFSVLFLTIFLLSCASKPIINNISEVSKMKLTSSAFNNNGFMPSRYTCDGQNISPPLTVSEVPEDARSLVLIMDDPDIPDFVKEKYGIQIWDHWIVFNIASTIKEISEGQNPAGILGKNTRGSNAYSGPCPPDAEHRYFFKLLALDSKLNLPAGSSKTQIEEAMNGHIIEKAELVGRYNRIKPVIK